MDVRKPSIEPVKIALLALGGQGGGTLTKWLAETAEGSNYIVQTTSVPGVAQRTGATIYYIETLPGEGLDIDHPPVLALMPVPGDVDLVVAAEMAEAGRAALRGLVSSDKTTLIASTHRDYATIEKVAMADGTVSSESIAAALSQSVKRYIGFDMQKIAEEEGSVISAVLLGAIAGSHTLPFSRSAYEAAISASGQAVDINLRAFDAGFKRAETYDATKASDNETKKSTAVRAEDGPIHPKVRELRNRIEDEFPSEAHAFLVEGVRRLVDYQDISYASLYLDRVREVRACEINEVDTLTRSKLTSSVARYLALWMSYEDTIRVADLKIRKARFKRVGNEVKVEPGQLLYFTEFMHPRVQEICETMPSWLGRRLLASDRMRNLLGRFTRKGRKISTSKLGGFLLLYFIASLRRWRRHTLRYAVEDARITEWLAQIKTMAERDYDSAVAMTECQRLIKGYGDTHERGWRSFTAILETVQKLPDEKLNSALIRTLNKAALADVNGTELEKTITETVP